jgi:hypothetical protein
MDDFFNTTFIFKKLPNLAKPSYGRSHFGCTTKLKEEKEKEKKKLIPISNLMTLILKQR